MEQQKAPRSAEPGATPDEPDRPSENGCSMAGAGKHTPGPWSLRKSRNISDDYDVFIVASQFGAIAEVATAVFSTSPDQKAAMVAGKANARLIAAAPQTKIERDALLEELKAIVRVKAETLRKSTSFAYEDLDDFKDRLLDCLKNIEFLAITAIAEAEGKS